MLLLSEMKLLNIALITVWNRIDSNLELNDYLYLVSEFPLTATKCMLQFIQAVIPFHDS